MNGSFMWFSRTGNHPDGTREAASFPVPSVLRFQGMCDQRGGHADEGKEEHRKGLLSAPSGLSPPIFVPVHRSAVPFSPTLRLPGFRPAAFPQFPCRRSSTGGAFLQGSAIAFGCRHVARACFMALIWRIAVLGRVVILYVII